MDEPENKDTTTNVDATVRFIDQNEDHFPKEMTTDIDYLNSTRDVDLRMLAEKPIFVSSFEWLPSQAVETNIYSAEFPEALFSASPALKTLTQNIAFCRPDIEIEIRVNGTAMQYGRLVFCWIPQASTLDKNYIGFPNAFSNKWYQASASTQQVIRFTVPYTLHKTYNTVFKPLEQFTLYCYVSASLQSVSGTASPVDVSIFAKLSPPRWAGYRFTPQASEPNVEMIMKSGVVSRALYKANDYVRRLIPVPGLGEYANPLSLLLKSSGDLAKKLGYSIPPNNHPSIS